MLRSKQCDDSLVELNRLLHTIEASGDVLYDWDLASDQLVWTGVTAALFGGRQQAPPATGEEVQTRIHPEDLPRYLGARAEQMANPGDYDCEYRLRGEDGHYHWVHDRGAVARAANGTPEHMLGVLRLVTRRKQHEARLEYLASFDDLTGQLNKQRLKQALDTALDDNGGTRRAGALLVLGIDQMSMVNAAYGHEAGDRIIFEIAQRLSSEIAGQAIIGRLDSDRFGMVLFDSSAQAAKQLAEQALQSVRQLPIDTGGRQVHVSASAGIVLFPDQAQTSFDAITKGDAALQNAKARGRDCVTFYEMTEAQRRNRLDSMNIGEEVKRALKDNRLCFAYQPVVDSESGAIRFHECLMRMRSPGGALVPAQRFVPVVESLGLIRTLDRRALELALADLEAFPQARLALNISGLTASDRGWLRSLTGRLKDRPDLASRLIVEITETAALQDIEESANFVTAIRSLGCRVAVDDFGAGYTTFRYLKALTVDLVKIDGSFVRGIEFNPQNRLFVRNLLDLAASFKLETVAECVETAGDADYLRSLGISLLQGYYFGKPQVAKPWIDEAGSEVLAETPARAETEPQPKKVQAAAR